jgi:hypothetical protein
MFLRLEMLGTNTILTQLGTTEVVTSIFVNKQLFVRNHSVEYVILSFSGKLQQVIKLRHSDTDGGGSTKNDEDRQLLSHQRIWNDQNVHIRQ